MVSDCMHVNLWPVDYELILLSHAFSIQAVSMAKLAVSKYIHFMLLILRLSNSL